MVAFAFIHGAALAGFEDGVTAYHRRDYATAFKELKPLAEQGNSNAQLFLGLMNDEGEGIPRDIGQAVYWYRKAAEQGNASAQLNLAHMFSEGRGMTKDDGVAAIWYRKAAEQGVALAQFNLGIYYANGRGVPKDDAQAVGWYRRAAEQGDARAQTNLGVMYRAGRGVPRDEQQAYFWALLGSAQGREVAQEIRDAIEPQLTPSQRANAQAAARNWRPITSEGAGGGQSQLVIPRTVAPDSTGSGFHVAYKQVLTNAHVVEGCARVTVGGRGAAKVLSADRRTDLALLSVESASSFASLRAGRLRQGDAITVVGYPLRGLLASGAQVTAGNVSALAGMQNDSRFIQISAPVQPGNSGGPLVDSSGNVVGVVVSKLNAVKMAQLTGDIPQNVNFAVSPLTLQGFLDANGVDYQTAPSNKNLSTADVADIAKKYTVLVECWK